MRKRKLRKELFLSFENQESRSKFGGTAFVEIQYCKLEPKPKIEEAVSISHFWENDSLFVFIDDTHIFYENYKDIFCGGYYNNLKSGTVDLLGINYYPPEQMKDIIDKIEKQKPKGYAIILEWLKRGSEYNGIFILGL